MKKRTRKDPNKYPAGWNRARVQQVIEYYDRQTDAEGAREIEAMPEAAPLTDVTWVAVPNRLLPQVRKLLNNRRRSA
jgi:hypothetical protein